MKVRNAALAIVLSLAVVQIQCSGKKESVRDEEANTGSGEKITLKIKYPPGKFEMVGDQKMKIDMTMKPKGGEPRDQAMDQRMQQWMGLDVSGPDAQGNTTMTMRFKRFRQEMKGGPINMVLDTNDKAALAANPAGQVFAAMLETELTMRMDRDGNVLEVKGMDEMWDRIALGNPQMAQMAAQLKQQFGGKTMAKMHTQAMQMAPKEPVGVGAVWYSDMKMPMPVLGEMTVDTKYKLISANKTDAGTIAVFTVHAIMTTDTAKTTKIGPASMEFKAIDMDMAGKVKVNVDTGLMLEQTMDMSGSFEMTVGAGDQEMEMEARLTGTQKTTITQAE